ncbi:D-serine dehydratase [Bacillus thuringiensis IBL 200]|nr:MULTISPECIES: hypothetical protein [Bacillus cereus group]EEM96447.1 D-serine dehydratase [Bacillus thuringiensis IBL 200]MCU4841799.1 hypothetical protein [Bacillus cereus]MED1641247.1 hypothetical protein [Bacillus thuringiensis]
MVDIQIEDEIQQLLFAYVLFKREAAADICTYDVLKLTILYYN